MVESKEQQGVSGFNSSFWKIDRESVTTCAEKKNGNMLQVNLLGNHGLRKIGCYLDSLWISINIILMMVINNEESKLNYMLRIQNDCAHFEEQRFVFISDRHIFT